MTRQGWIRTLAGVMATLALACSPPPSGDSATSATASTPPHSASSSSSEPPAGKPALGEPEYGDWLIRHILSDPEQLNPFTSNDATASSILGMVFESLLDRDPDTVELRPSLAASRPTISADHLTYTFTLRDDAHFSDGTQVTVEDVLFSMKVIKSTRVNAPFLRVYYASISDAEIVDQRTIRFTAQEPYFQNESVLGTFDILPRHYYDPDGHLAPVTLAQVVADDPAVADRLDAFANQFNRDYARNPLGSGPYTFREWNTGDRVILDRDPNYWGNVVPSVEHPYINRLIYRVVNNVDAALVSLKSGDLDVLSLQPLQHLRQTDGARFQKNFDKLRYYSPGYTYIGWNNDHAIFADPKVRTAMTMLTNRQALVDTVLFGLGQVVDSPIYRYRPEYDESLVPPAFDPDGALALLADAGWTDSDGDGTLDREVDGQRIPLEFEIKINSGNDTRKSVALTLQDELKRHGVTVRLRELDWTIFLDDVRNHRFDAVILGWAMNVTEPDGFQVWHSSQMENGGSNFISYGNDRVDEILSTYRRTFDPTERTRLYKEFQRILNREQPYTFLFMGDAITAYQRRFQNVAALPIGGPVTTRWWVPKADQRYTTTPAAPTAE